MFFDIVVRRLFYLAALILVSIIELQTFAYNPCGDQYQTAGENQQFKDICGGVMWRSLKWFVGLEANTLNAYSTLITALSTIFIAFFTFSLMRSTKRQWDVANRNFIATHRPRVVVRFVVGIGFEDERYSAHVTVVNVGASDATITELRGGLIRRNRKKVVLPPGRVTYNSEVFIVLRSGEKHTYQIISSYLRDTYFTEDLIEQNETCAVGFIRYGDQNGVIRETGFFRVYDPKRTEFLIEPGAEDEYQD